MDGDYIPPMTESADKLGLPGVILLALVAIIGGTVLGAGGMRAYSERNERAEHAEPVVIGNGFVLRAKGLSVILGPVSVSDNNGTMPVYVEERATNDYAVSCLMFDEHKRFIGGGGLAIPPKYAGFNLKLGFDHEIKGGSVQCKLVKP